MTTLQSTTDITYAASAWTFDTGWKGCGQHDTLEAAKAACGHGDNWCVENAETDELLAASDGDLENFRSERRAVTEYMRLRGSKR